eukprot:626728-Pelagomonas_calceolata.AAC.1
MSHQGSRGKKTSKETHHLFGSARTCSKVSFYCQLLFCLRSVQASSNFPTPTCPCNTSLPRYCRQQRHPQQQPCALEQRPHQPRRHHQHAGARAAAGGPSSVKHALTCIRRSGEQLGLGRGGRLQFTAAAAAAGRPAGAAATAEAAAGAGRY